MPIHQNPFFGKIIISNLHVVKSNGHFFVFISLTTVDHSFQPETLVSLTWLPGYHSFMVLLLLPTSQSPLLVLSCLISKCYGIQDMLPPKMAPWQ